MTPAHISTILPVIVEGMIMELRVKIEKEVPDEGDFPMVYSEFKLPDRKTCFSDMCLTDIMLKLSPMPSHLPNREKDRWLELVGYKLPAPYKSTTIIFKGTKDEVLKYLDQPEAAEKILRLIPRLDDNLSDV